MKKILTVFSALLILGSLGCKNLLPQDPFIAMKNDEVLAPCAFLKTNGGYDGKNYDLSLAFTDAQRKMIKAVEWKLLNSLDDVVRSRIDTVADSKKEEERVWPNDYNFVFSTGLLPIENYRLLVTVYDDFKKQGDKVVFRDAKFKRTFTFEFLISQPPSLSGLFVRSLGPGQDTGYSKTDRITKFNKNLDIYGETIVNPDITSDSATKVYITISKLPGNSEIKRSPDLHYTGEGSVANSLLWNWRCTDELTDGQWSVVLNMEYKDSNGDMVSSKSESSFILAIDTVAPQVCWDYKLDSGNLIKNTTRDIDLPITDLIEFDFGFPVDLEGDSLKDEKRRFKDWTSFSLVDYTQAHPSGQSGADNIFTGTNFIAVQEGDYKGFSPYIAGTQEITVTAWDAAGNKATNLIKRRVKIKDPVLKHNFQNADFSAVEGASGYTDRKNLEKARYTHWDSLIFWVEYYGQPYEKGPSKDNAPRISTEGWNHNFLCYVKNEGGNQVLNFTEKHSAGVSRWLICTGGKVYQKFTLCKGVSYNLSGKSMNGSEKNTDEPAALFVEHAAPDAKPDDFTGNGKTGDFPFSLSAGISEGNHIYYKPFTLKNGTWEDQTLSFTVPSTGHYNMGFAKKGFSVSGYKGGGWTLCDDANLSIVDWPKVDGTVLTP